MATTVPPIDRAVVVGGSIAGLAAAATLAARVPQVLLVERRTARETGSVAPQGHLPHVMLAPGARVLEQLFPGFAQDLLDAGAVTGGEDPTLLPCHWAAHGSLRRHLRMPDAGFPRALCSRLLVESRLRAATLALPQVHAVRASAERLLLDDDPDAGPVATGVRLRGSPAEPAGHHPGDLPADLVIDATGRAGQLTRALPTAPQVSEVVVDLRYTAFVVDRRPGDLGGAAFAVVQNTRSIPRVGVALPMEGERWQVVLGGYFGDAAPVDPDGATAFAGTLADPALVPLLGRPYLGEPARYTFGASRRRHWDRWTAHPGHLCVIGDAVASFNPVYGQGMTSALLQAEELGAALDRRRDARPGRDPGREPGPALARRMAAIADNPWLTATGADFAYPRTQGRRPRGNGLVNRYVDRVTRAAATDEVVNAAFTEVQQLSAAPPTLFHPRIALRALRHGSPTPHR